LDEILWNNDLGVSPLVEAGPGFPGLRCAPAPAAGAHALAAVAKPFQSLTRNHH